MLLDVLALIVGLVFLYYGAEWLVRGASRLATSLGISALMIGLTIVAVGTSMPELVVSILAASAKNSDIVLGNIVGSNIANIGLILGISGLIAPLTIHISLIRREIPVMIVATIATLLLVLDGNFNVLDGLLFLVGYVVFIYVLYRTDKGTDAEGTAEIESELVAIEGTAPIRRGVELAIIAIGLVALIIGAQLLVSGAVNLARAFGVSELLIGLTLVAVGTSLPELATSTVASYRGHADIAVGNVVGSNIANLLLIFGFTPIINTVNVGGVMINRDIPVAIGFASLLMFFVLFPKRRLVRWQSSLFLLAYAAYVLVAFLQDTAR
jgi:cation:H+ antiporter